MNYNELCIYTCMVSQTYGNRSMTPKVVKGLFDSGKLEAASQLIYKTILRATKGREAMGNYCPKLATKLVRMSGIEQEVGEQSLYRLGLHATDWCREFVKPEKELVYRKVGQKPKEQWLITSVSEEFSKEVELFDETKDELPFVQYGWTKPLQIFNNKSVEIVRGAQRFGMLDHYKLTAMPSVYSSLNKLNEQAYCINYKLLDFATKGHPFVPREVPEDERRAAVVDYSRNRRIARSIEESKMIEMNKWLLENTDIEDQATVNAISKSKACAEAEDFLLVRSEGSLETMSDWSKRYAFEQCVSLARRAPDILHYLWNCDSRGRVYTVQNFLEPQGSDFSKALLLLDSETIMDRYWFCVHIANCFGEDKLSFDDRVQWVSDNQIDIYNIGLGHTDSSLFKKLSAEKKTKWAGLAACIEFVNLTNHREQTPDLPYYTNLPIALDATNSGSQVLSGIARDEEVAALVNLSDADKPQDLYAFVGNILRERLDGKTTQPRIQELVDLYPQGHKMWRKIAKRTVMCDNYDLTMRGAMNHTYSDRKDHGCELFASFNIKETNEIGKECLSACADAMKGSAALKNHFKAGVSNNKSAVISWTLPDGFTAFQVRDKMKEDTITDTVCGVKVNLKFYKPSGKPENCKHKSAISANTTHSLDGYLLREIVRNHTGQLQVVHDAFGTSSDKLDDLVGVARVAYISVMDRNILQGIVNEQAGEIRELPEAGQWDPRDLETATYFVC